MRTKFLARMEKWLTTSLVFILLLLVGKSNDAIGQTLDTPDFRFYYPIEKGEIIKLGDLKEEVDPSEKLKPKGLVYDDMQVAWYIPHHTPGKVGRYEKVELGIRFDRSIDGRIEGYDYDNEGINPFNPDQVDLYANFWHWNGADWEEAGKVNGFYYVEYQRNKKNWTEVKRDYHNFRIRFAPEDTGLYKCEIIATVAGFGELKNKAFIFESFSSDNLGFVNVGNNKRYLKVGDEPFFPVGQNLTGPNTPGLTIEWRDTPAPPELYDNFYNLMSELEENGANYFRYIVSPWQSEIEFEKLGDYSNRMSNAWEFDQLLDTAKFLGLKIHYNMAMHYSFEAPSSYAMTFWDWTARGDTLSPYLPKDSPCFREHDLGYCYRNELDLENPLDFLTDSLAMVYYKRRIRYMVARWGYSTEIGIMELLSEANNFGSEGLIEYDIVNGRAGCRRIKDTLGLTTHPYKDEPLTIIPDLMAWQIEMCRYIKEDLGHTQHPIAINYTGGPDLEKGDSTYYSKYVDIASYNSYFLAVDKTEKTYDAVTGFYHNTDEGEAFLDKPMMNSEYGANAGTYRCDDNAGFIRRVCLTPFTGTATSAMTWDSHLNEQDVWKHLGPVRALFEGVPLDEGNWTAQAPMVQRDQSVEIFHLRKEERGENSEIIGAISNRTYNYWTQGDTIDCIQQYKRPEDAYATAVDFRAEDLSKGKMKFKNMGTRVSYRIEWYNAISGEPVMFQEQKSNSFGRFVLQFPGWLTGGASSPILYFKMYPVNQ